MLSLGNLRVGAVAALLATTLAGCGSDALGVTAPASMEPTLQKGEKVTVDEVDTYEPQRGDIVLFEDPGGWLGPAGDDSTGSLIKRVIGVSGDTITCCDSDGWLEIDGEPLEEEYLAEDHGRCAAVLPPIAGQKPCDWTVGPVPDDALFVLGDNRSFSADSRFHLCPPDDVSCKHSPWVDVDLVQGTIEP